ncbi:MAG: GHKL domain-containing protein [Lachnospiraceae bacterium]|nr:GHKL domain-containing protein [Lachnospiraceae bacterium]
MKESVFLQAVNTIAIYAIFVLTGFCYARWLAPFMKKKQTAYLAAGIYVVLTVMLNLIPEEIGDTPFKFISVIVPLCLMYVLERRNLEQKIFLCMVFVVLRWLAIGTFAEIGFYERDFVFGFELFRSSVTAILVEYVVWEILWVVGTVVVLNLAVRFVLKVYQRKSENLTAQELVMLLAPVGAVLTVKPMISEYYDLWGEGIRAGFIQKNIPGNIYRLLFYAFSFGAILVLISFYQQIKSRQEEEEGTRILEQQIADNKKHLEQVEDYYADMRALKHDMGNHITTLEHLIRQGSVGEATAYVEELGTSFHEVQPKVRTGNPVTDVILSEYARSFEKEGISFSCNFVYPIDTKMNAFDLSIILNNALQNALEGTRSSPAPKVSIDTVRKGSIYLIDVRNPIRDRLKVNEETGLPETCKEEPGHGYGLRNIQHVAALYQGAMDIRQEADEKGELWFVLNVLLIS